MFEGIYIYFKLEFLDKEPKMSMRLRCWEDDLAVHFVLCVRRLADEVEPLLLENPPGEMTGGDGGDNLYII